MVSLLILWNRQDIDTYKNSALVAFSDLSAHGVEQTDVSQERHDGNQGVCSPGVNRKKASRVGVMAEVRLLRRKLGSLALV